MEHADFILGRLRAAREKLGIPIAELARRTEIGESNLGKALRGKRDLKADELVRLCYALELNELTALIPKDMLGRLIVSNRGVRKARPRARQHPGVTWRGGR